MKPEDKQNLSNFFIAQYNNYTNVLNRIKQDEQRWIQTLLLIYGAVITFIITDHGNSLVFKGEFEKLIILILTFIIISLISFVWSHQSLNLRIQYYRTMFKIQELRLSFNIELDGNWKDTSFNDWRKKVTRPCETKIVEFWLLGGLNLVTGVLAIYKFSVQSVCHHANACQLNILLELCILLASILLLIIFLFFPLLYFPCRDRKLLLKLFEKKYPVKPIKLNNFEN